MTFVHRCKWNVPTGRCFNCILTLTTGADPRFQVKRGVLKKIAPSGGGARKFLGYFVWKITILCQKIIFFPILGGACTGCAPLDHGSIIECEVYMKWSCRTVKYLPNLKRCWFAQSVLLIQQPVDVTISNEWRLTNQHVVSLYWTGCVHNHEEVHMC